MASVTICSKLPNGLILQHPKDPTKKVEIRGLNGAPRGKNGAFVQLPYITTEVDQEYWETWKAEHKNFAPLVSRSIFEAKNESEAKVIARANEKRRTGFENMSQNEDPRMGGAKVKPAAKD